MTQPIRAALVAGASLLALATAAAAQSTADLYDLGTLVVDGTADPSDPVPGYVATTAATATKTGTPILETQQSISVITGEQIEDQAHRSLADVLRYVPGVTIGQGEGQNGISVTSSLSVCLWTRLKLIKSGKWISRRPRVSRLIFQ